MSPSISKSFNEAMSSSLAFLLQIKILNVKNSGYKLYGNFMKHLLYRDKILNLS